MGSSPFYKPPPIPGDPIQVGNAHIDDKPVTQAKYSGPTTKELERWYNELNESVGSPGEMKDRIEDVRDEIYSYLP